MSDDKSSDKEKVLETIVFTPDQKKQIAKVAGREINVAKLVELSPTEARRLAPGILRASAIVMCW